MARHPQQTYPGHRILNYDAGPHRCPLCNHRCVLPRTPSPVSLDERKMIGAAPTGRPPTSRIALLKLLDAARESGEVLSVTQLAAEMDITETSVRTLIWRMRREGFDIRHILGEGYELRPVELGAGVPRDKNGR